MREARATKQVLDIARGKAEAFVSDARMDARRVVAAAIDRFDLGLRAVDDLAGSRASAHEEAHPISRRQREAVPVSGGRDGLDGHVVPLEGAGAAKSRSDLGGDRPNLGIGLRNEETLQVRIVLRCALPSVDEGADGRNEALMLVDAAPLDVRLQRAFGVALAEGENRVARPRLSLALDGFDGLDGQRGGGEAEARPCPNAWQLIPIAHDDQTRSRPVVAAGRRGGEDGMHLTA